MDAKNGAEVGRIFNKSSKKLYKDYVNEAAGIYSASKDGYGENKV